MNSISSSRKHLDEIIRARWTKVLIKLILRCWRQNESNLVYRPEKVGFLYTEVRKAVEVLCTNTSKKASWWLDSFSTVNFKEGCIEFNCMRNESVSFVVNITIVHEGQSILVNKLASPNQTKIFTSVGPRLDPIATTVNLPIQYVIKAKLERRGGKINEIFKNTFWKGRFRKRTTK